MKLKMLITASILFCFSMEIKAQKQGNVWTFGHYAAVDFNGAAPLPDSSRVVSRGSCASICDSSGALLLYASYDTSNFTTYTPLKAYNKYHQVILNGDSLKGAQSLYQELVIIPYPGSDSLFYIFSIGVVINDGLWYNIVDMSANGGLGAVILKNQQLQTFKVVDCLTAVKHGNGRDWWIIFRKSDFPNGSNNQFYVYLINPAGISDSLIQSVGSQNSTNAGKISFNSNGSKFVFVNIMGLFELYDFDRCTGIISNPVNIHPEASSSPFETYWGACFSPSDSILYVTKFPLTNIDTSRLYQFDLTASNILQSADTLKESFYDESLEQLNRAPDGKIYYATFYNQTYPFNSATYNTTNTNLSVINSPDNLGSACNLTQYSFYLGGKRVYAGLPNNPDYHLGPKIGSGCDTLTAINEHSQNLVISNLAPNPNNGEFTVNYFLPNGKSGELEILNLTGQRIFHQHLPRYTYLQNISLKNLPQGIYLLKISGGGKVGVKKFVVQY